MGQDSPVLTSDPVFAFSWVWGTLSDSPTKLAFSGWGHCLRGKRTGDIEVVQEVCTCVIYSARLSLSALVGVNFIAALAIRIEIGNIRKKESTVSGKKREAVPRRAT